MPSVASRSPSSLPTTVPECRWSPPESRSHLASTRKWMPWWRSRSSTACIARWHVQQHAVVAAPVGQAGVRAEAAGEEVVHDDRHAERLGELGALVHLLRRRRGHVQVVALALAGLGLGLLHRLGDEVEAVAPAHERLRVDVLVVLGEVQAAAQAFVHRAAVVLRRQAELGLDGAAEQRPAVLVHDVALDLRCRAAGRRRSSRRRAESARPPAAARGSP